MDEIARLVRTYNDLIGDLEGMRQEIRKVVRENHKLEFKWDYWSPRSTYAWPVKETYYALFIKESSPDLLLVGINLIADVPYLSLARVRHHDAAAMENGMRNYHDASAQAIVDGRAMTTRLIREKKGSIFTRVVERPLEPDEKSDRNNYWQYMLEAIYAKIELLSIGSSSIIRGPLGKLIGVMLAETLDIGVNPGDFPELGFLEDDT